MAISTVPPIPKSLDFADDDKPYFESLGGQLVRKMSPRRMHARLQVRIATWLDEWAGASGEVGMEWRFYFLRTTHPSSLLPDVAYVSYERLPRTLPEDARERPRVAPDIAVEIWSPGDRAAVLSEKVRLYLANGSRVVIVVYPKRRKIVFHSTDAEIAHPAAGKLRVPGYDGLTLDADALFREF
ncbi:MAG TPA: Uma2 family endonuclease [Candidatus Baltobacteraceae bacterium]